MNLRSILFFLLCVVFSFSGFAQYDDLDWGLFLFDPLGFKIAETECTFSSYSWGSGNVNNCVLPDLQTFTNACDIEGVYKWAFLSTYSFEIGEAYTVNYDENEDFCRGEEVPIDGSAAPCLPGYYVDWHPSSSSWGNNCCGDDFDSDVSLEGDDCLSFVGGSVCTNVPSDQDQQGSDAYTDAPSWNWFSASDPVHRGKIINSGCGGVQLLIGGDSSTDQIHYCGA